MASKSGRRRVGPAGRTAAQGAQRAVDEPATAERTQRAPGGATRPAPACAPLSVRRIGSFHVGGALVTVTGLPLRERVSTPGGPVHPIDPNGELAAGQMYVQYVRLSGPRARPGRRPSASARPARGIPTRRAGPPTPRCASRWRPSGGS